MSITYRFNIGGNPPKFGKVNKYAKVREQYNQVQIAENASESPWFSFEDVGESSVINTMRNVVYHSNRTNDPADVKIKTHVVFNQTTRKYSLWVKKFRPSAFEQDGQVKPSHD